MANSEYQPSDVKSLQYLIAVLKKRLHDGSADGSVRIEDLIDNVPAAQLPQVLAALLTEELDILKERESTIPAWSQYKQRFSNYPDCTEKLKETYEVWGLPHHNDYTFVRPLGKGAFGSVYLATQKTVQRWVAIKVPRVELPTDKDQRERLLKRQDLQDKLGFVNIRAEATHLATIDHPNVVRVYDAPDFMNIAGEKTLSGPVIVQEFVEGTNLKDHLESQYRKRKKQVPVAEAVRLIRGVCLGLQAVHSAGIYHRDLKPANILLNDQSQPKIADFGLAIEATRHHDSDFAGTLAYMAPEQLDDAPGKIKGYTDIWAVGVMLYEILAGQRPFSFDAGGKKDFELLEVVRKSLEYDPRPLGEFRNDVPVVLWRICLRCLAKDRFERFQWVGELIEALDRVDLQSGSFTLPAPENAGSKPNSSGPHRGSERHDHSQDSSNVGKLTTPPNAVAPPVAPIPSEAPVVPHGLLPFTETDKAFFLRLLPGTRNEQGLPPAVAYWKNRIEERDHCSRFLIGLLYGPSGCGKTSLMKAGILPLLSDEILPIYVEATASDTEQRLSRQLLAKLPGLPEKPLPELLYEIRRQWDRLLTRRLLLVFDQFEQWLHTHYHFPQEPLTKALRQCDGIHIQAILMIRDDFYVPAEEFLKQMDIPTDEKANKLLVPLFKKQHARRVLEMFGIAQKRLPEREHDQSTDQKAFLDKAIAQLQNQNEQVACVHLSLFVQMYGERDWVPSELARLGGAQRLGEKFLEETFEQPEHRDYATGARRVLRALLPLDGTEIKGAMQPLAALQQVANVSAEKFQRLMSGLEKTLRIITPTTPGNSDAQPTTDNQIHGSDEAPVKYYQLTHDYLVPALRIWLTRKQKETAQGRAELLLEERTGIWLSRPEARQLPSMLEYLKIRQHVQPANWTEPQRRLMSLAKRRHWTRVLSASLICWLLLCGFWQVQKKSDKAAAEQLASVIRDCRTSDLPLHLPKLVNLKPYITQELQDKYKNRKTLSAEAKLHLAIALLTLNVESPPTQEKYCKDLQDYVLRCRPEQLEPLVSLLRQWKDDLRKGLEDTLENPTEKPATRLYAGCLLACWGPSEIAEFPEKLATLYADPQITDATRSTIAGILIDNSKTRSDLEKIDIYTNLWQHADRDIQTLLRDQFRLYTEAYFKSFNKILAEKGWPQWPELVTGDIPEETQNAISKYQGFIDKKNGYALCLAVPVSEFKDISEQLSKYGYHPKKLRPSSNSMSDTPSLSAIWIADGVKSSDRNFSDLSDLSDKSRLTDFAWIPGSAADHRLLAVELDGDSEQAAWGKPEQIALRELSKLSGNATNPKDDTTPSPTVLTASAYVDESKQLSFCILQRDSTAPPSTLKIINPASIHKDILLTDISSIPNADLKDSEPKPLESRSTFEQRLINARREFYRSLSTREKTATPDGLDATTGNDDEVTQKKLFRSLFEASHGRSEEAEEILEELEKLERVSDSDLVSHKAQIAAFSKNTSDLLQFIEECEGASEFDNADLAKTVACCWWIYRARHSPESSNDTTAKDLQERALRLLQKALSAGDLEPDWYLALEFDELRKTAEFQQLIRMCTTLGIVSNDPTLNLESRIVSIAAGQSVAGILRPLAEDSWRAVATCNDGTGGFHILLHRRRLTSQETDDLARRKAAAKLALFHIHQDAGTWPKPGAWPELKDKQDSRLRSYLLHSLEKYTVSREQLLKEIQNRQTMGKENPGILRGLIQGLGELLLVELKTNAGLPAKDRLDIQKTLGEIYATHADPGIHSMCAWVLSHLGDPLPAISAGPMNVGNWLEAEIPSLDSPGDPLRLRFVIIEPGTYEIGSPLHEEERDQIEPSRRTHQLRERIAISSYEISNQLVLEYLKSEARTKDDPPPEFLKAYDPSHPFNFFVQDNLSPPSPLVVPGRFLNWLSSKLGISFDQLCYEEDGQLKRNYATLEGLRVPTTAELEIAMRGGTTTARFFGETSDLLRFYSNSTESLRADLQSSGVKLLPVGSFRPNPFGVFDCYGNAPELAYKFFYHIGVGGSAWSANETHRSASRQAYTGYGLRPVRILIKKVETR